MNDELLDIVNEKNEVIGQEWRSVIHEKRELHKMRAVWLFVQNNKGQLWIPRRVAHKKVRPLALDGSAVGCVSAGETYEQALMRETQEELNIRLSKHDYSFCGYLNPSDGMLCHVQVYHTILHETPQYDKNEFCESFWLYPQEILDLWQKGETMKPSLPKIVKRYFL